MSEEETEGNAFEAEFGAQAVDDEALVSDMRGFRLIGADDKGGGRDLDLGDVIKFNRSAFVDRRWMVAHHFIEEAVEFAGGDALFEGCVGLIDQLEDALDAGAGHCGTKDDGCVGEEFHFVADLFLEFLHRFLAFGFEIPFVDHDDHAAIFVVCKASDLGILFGDSFGSIDQKECDITAIQSIETLVDAQAFESFGDVLLASDTSGIDEEVFFVVAVYNNIDSIACGSGFGHREQAFFAEQMVDQG